MEGESPTLKYSVPKQIPIVFHYHFIIKRLAEEFEGQFSSSLQNTEK